MQAEEPGQDDQKVPVRQQGEVGYTRVDDELDGSCERLRTAEERRVAVLLREIDDSAPALRVELPADLPLGIRAPTSEDALQDRVVVDRAEALAVPDVPGNSLEREPMRRLVLGAGVERGEHFGTAESLTGVVHSVEDVLQDANVVLHDLVSRDREPAQVAGERECRLLMLGGLGSFREPGEHLGEVEDHRERDDEGILPSR